ncbi:MAG: hypothetical protein Ct9H300mP1_35590 [Planctomycetaceae bacterium]|nr:MAG: hypothetical protein Ct9H300mP1_35590 [Planctomycetaceae bacterium]
MLDGADLDRATRSAAISAVLAVGGPDDLRTYGLTRNDSLEMGDTMRHFMPNRWGGLGEVTRFRKVRPSGDWSLCWGLDRQGSSRVQARLLGNGGSLERDRVGDVLAAAGNDRLPGTFGKPLWSLGALKVPAGREC